MTQARNAMLREINNLLDDAQGAAGQKARGGWQGLPGAALMEAAACR
jgi:hypothetical protein